MPKKSFIEISLKSCNCLNDLMILFWGSETLRNEKNKTSYYQKNDFTLYGAGDKVVFTCIHIKLITS